MRVRWCGSLPRGTHRFVSIPLTIVALALPVPRVAAAQVPTDTLRPSPVSIAPTDSLPAQDTTQRADGAVGVATSYARPGIFAGSRQEEMLRTLQQLGAVPLHPWSVRAFGPRELERLGIKDDAAIPESMRRALHVDRCDGPCDASRRVRAGVLPVEASAWFNSTRPFGMNDGVVWAGRGLTLAAMGGVYAQAGPLSAVIAPVVTWAQNQAFALEPNGLHDSLRFADALFPRSVDNPQRFGDDPYVRVDPGESTVRLDLFGVVAGVSTASQWWGPMQVYPYLMSNNAGGFPHVFVGTSRPANVGIGRLHARVIYGDLAESAYATGADSASRRFASGIVAVFVPRGLPGLEVGGARFFHSIWPPGGITSGDLAKPFEGLLKESSVGRNSDGTLREDVHNQLASFFMRLTLPRSGVEIYGEFGREDHNADLRDFWMEPDHDAAYGLGLRRAWKDAAGMVSAFGVEMMNTRITHLDRTRPQVAPYLHGMIRQGHTSRGQVLGSPLGPRAGDAVTLSFQRFSDAGSTTWQLARMAEAGGVEGDERRVRFIAGVERGLRRGPVELLGALRLVQREGRDEPTGATSLNLQVQARWMPGR